MPTMASVLNIHLGNLGSTRYQCPRAISPVTPPRARAADIAGAHPPDEAWMSRATPAKTWRIPEIWRLRAQIRARANRIRPNRAHHESSAKTPTNTDRGGDGCHQPGETGPNHPRQGDRSRDQGQSGSPRHQDELGSDKGGQVVGHGAGSYGNSHGVTAGGAADRIPPIGTTRLATTTAIIAENARSDPHARRCRCLDRPSRLQRARPPRRGDRPDSQDDGRIGLQLRNRGRR